MGFVPVPQRVLPHAPPQTFRLRRGRVTAGQADALERLFPVLGVRVLPGDAPLDLRALFGRDAPVVLEVGSGMGEATAAAAATDPARDLLAVDVHTPGLASLLVEVERGGLTNVRVADGDARVLLADLLGPGVLDEVRVWFPDPWPKTRHAGRRLLTPGFLALVADRLRPGGRLHVATDWAPYAEQVAGHLAADPDLDLVNRERPPERPRTRFEQQGLRAGRSSYDLVAVRRAAVGPAQQGQ